MKAGAFVSDKLSPARLERWAGRVLMMLLCLSGFGWAGWVDRAESASVVVTPAKLEVHVDVGSMLGPIQVRNTGHEVLDVRSYVALGGHDAAGTPRYNEDADARSFAGSLLQIQPSSFQLSSGEMREVRMQVIGRPATSGAYPVLFFEFRAANEGLTPSSGVAGVARVAVLMLLTFPRQPQVQASITHLDFDQTVPGGPVQVIATVLNGGDIHLRPSGFVDIRGPGNTGPIDRVLLEPAVVLPGQMRRLKGVWRPNSLAPGMLQAHASLTVDELPAGHFDARPNPPTGFQPMLLTTFVAPVLVVSAGELARIRGTVTDVAVTEGRGNGPIRVVALFRNDGNIPFLPHAAIRIDPHPSLEQSDAFELPLRTVPVLPGQTEAFSGLIEPGLPVGTYQAHILVWETGREEPVTSAPVTLQVSAGHP